MGNAPQTRGEQNDHSVAMQPAVPYALVPTDAEPNRVSTQILYHFTSGAQ